MYKYLILLLTSGSLLGQTTYYLDPDWAGTKSGTQAQPFSVLDASAWSTINTALGSADVIIYFSARDVTGANDIYGAGVEVTDKTPSPGNRLTFDGDSFYNTNDSTPNWIANTTSFRSQVKYFNSQNIGHVKYDDVTIRGFRIIRDTPGKAVTLTGDNFYLESSEVSHTAAVNQGPLCMITPTSDGSHEGSSSWTPPCDNLRIVNCVFHDSYGEYIYVGGGGSNPGDPGSGYPSHTNILIANNEIYPGSLTINGGSDGQRDGIDVKGGIVGLDIFGNFIHDLDDDDTRPIVMQGQEIGAANQDTNIAYNRIRNCKVAGGGIVCSDSWGAVKDVDIYNNILYDLTSFTNPNGIRIFGTQNVANTVRIMNNSIYNFVGSGVDIVIDNQPQARVYARNNIFVNGDGVISIGGGVTLDSDYNLHNSTSAIEGSNTLDITDISRLFASPSTGDFRLPTGSPAINQGETQTGFSDDFIGGTRTGTWDIGAYESGSGGEPPPPPPPPAPTGGIATRMVVWEDDLRVTDGGNNGYIVQSPVEWHQRTLDPRRIAMLALEVNTRPTITDVTAAFNRAKLNYNHGLGYISDQNVQADPWDDAPAFLSAMLVEAPKFAPGQTIRVRVKKTTPDSAYSNELILTLGDDADPPPPVPAVPSSVTGSASSDTTILVNWSAVDADTYDIRVDGGSVHDVSGITGLSRSLTGLTPSTSYAIEVRGVNTTGAGSYSSPINVTTQATPPPPPPPPSGFTKTFPADYPAGSTPQAAFSDSSLRGGNRVGFSNGTWTGQFTCSLRGEPGNPIVFQSINPWGAVFISPVDRRTGSNPPAVIRPLEGGQAVDFIGFRMYAASGDRTDTRSSFPDPSQQSNPDGANIPYSEGIFTRMPYSRSLFNAIHDLRQGWVCQVGVGYYSWSYGNIIYNTGWRSGVRDNGPTMYFQHGQFIPFGSSNYIGGDGEGLIVEDNILKQGFGPEICQAFGSSSAIIDNITFRGNYALSDPSRVQARIILGGQGTAAGHRIRVLENWCKDVQLDAGYNAGVRHSNMRFEDNYGVMRDSILGGAGQFSIPFQYIKISNSFFPADPGSSQSARRPAFTPVASFATFLRNTAVRFPNGGAGRTFVRFINSDGSLHVNIDDNQWYGTSGYAFIGYSSGEEATLRSRLTSTGITGGVPSVDVSQVDLYRLQPWGRPMCKVVGHDYDGNNSITFSVGTRLTSGASYSLYNAEDMTAGGSWNSPYAPVQTGTYNGSTITVSLAGLSVAQFHDDASQVTNTKQPNYFVGVLLQN